MSEADQLRDENSMLRRDINQLCEKRDKARSERKKARSERDEAIRERVEYLGSWLEWLEANDGLEIREWLLAYADATPEPTDSEDAETICGFIDRKMIAAAAEIQRLREERDEARREVCEFELVNMKQAHEYAAYRGWDCFADLAKPKDCRTISGIPTESTPIDPKRE